MRELNPQFDDLSLKHPLRQAAKSRIEEQPAHRAAQRSANGAISPSLNCYTREGRSAITFRST
jgi:hypothetical protein